MGLSSTLPATLTAHLTAYGVPAALAHQVAQHPPAAYLFAAFLGANPARDLLAPTGVLTRLPAGSAATLSSGQFFPRLLTGPLHTGLALAFAVAAGVLVLAAGVSLVAGRFSRASRAATVAEAPLAPSHGP